jgi:hypothetical protein
MEDHFGPASIDAAGNWQNSVEGLSHANVVVIYEPFLGADNSPPLPDVMDLDLPDPKSKCVMRQGGCQ